MLAFLSVIASSGCTNNSDSRAGIDPAGQVRAAEIVYKDATRNILKWFLNNKKVHNALAE